MSHTDLTVVNTYPDRHRAENGRGALHAANIESIIEGDDPSKPSLSAKKHNLLVRVDDIDRASGILGRGENVAGMPLREESRIVWIGRLSKDLRDMRPGRR